MEHARKFIIPMDVHISEATSLSLNGISYLIYCINKVVSSNVYKLDL